MGISSRIRPLLLARTPRNLAFSSRVPRASALRPAWAFPINRRPSRAQFYATKSTADELMEHITEQYATAKDEFEIALEETEKLSIYAEDDRVAAREELDKLHEMYNSAIQDLSVGEEVKSRVGPRVRELDSAVKAMEELAKSQD